MTVVANCDHCGAIFEADDRLAGGITSCPDCGKAVEVPGLRDPLFWLGVAGGVVATLFVAALVWRGVSPAAGIGTLVAGGLLGLVIAKSS